MAYLKAPRAHNSLEHFERKKAEQNLKTILVNQKLLQTKNQKEKSQKEDEAKNRRRDTREERRGNREKIREEREER